ncbi:MAG: hypothetical protein QOH35_460, partial [Acidobacteriaceae bacterium]|nr:hypothetical protein [Acidobacteriaceae bacterium]
MQCRVQQEGMKTDRTITYMFMAHKIS